MLCEVGKKDMQLKRLFWTIIGAVMLILLACKNGQQSFLHKNKNYFSFPPQKWGGFFFAVFQKKNRAPEFRGSEKIIQLIRSVIIQGS